jgi:hypothetical protein
LTPASAAAAVAITTPARRPRPLPGARIARARGGHDRVSVLDTSSEVLDADRCQITGDRFNTTRLQVQTDRLVTPLDELGGKARTDATGRTNDEYTGHGYPQLSFSTYRVPAIHSECVTDHEACARATEPENGGGDLIGPA